jgi:protein-arginine kinase activator protein McsA
MENDKTKIAIAATKRMIADTEAKLQKAIERENWTRAAELQPFINGMYQVLAIFEQAFPTL